jgi:beta-phosphoglucomutase-like phosphatase (HAD superfamily)
MGRPIQAVVFDMDGVLIDSEPLWREVERAVFGGLGIHVTDPDLEETMGVRINEVVALWRNRHPWNDPSPEEIEDRIVEGVARAIQERGVVNGAAAGAIAYFQGLGLRLALASSSPYRLIDAVLSVSRLGDRFETVHSAEEEASGKPDPAVYLTTARKLGVPPEHCVAIEDSPSGVRSARAAGMLCVAVPERPQPGDGFHGADLVLDSLAAVGDWMWPALEAEPAPATRR